MQAVSVALGAASLVAVPLVFGMWLLRRKGERHHRRVSAGARGHKTEIALVGREAAPESDRPRRSRNRSRRSRRQVIDLFSGQEPPSSAE